LIIVIDNYDSFTYNLVQYLGSIGQEVQVIRNDVITVKQLEKKNPSRIIISPGPGWPKDAGISLEVVQMFAPRIPILGVCLGHQSIGEAFGGVIVKAPQLMHGKASLIFHDHKDNDDNKDNVENKNTLFKDIPNPFSACRYHSLIIDPESMPDCLETIAWTKEQDIMAIRHKNYPTYGMQFHPESILTEQGLNLIKNFISI